MGINLFDRTTELLQTSLDRRNTSHRLITRNLANVDTPNYRGTGLEFQKQLRQAIDGSVLPTSLAKTHPLHMPVEEPKPFDNAQGEYMDTGPVHLDIEMSKLAENNIMFSAMVQLLGKKFSTIKAALQEKGAA